MEFSCPMRGWRCGGPESAAVCASVGHGEVPRRSGVVEARATVGRSQCGAQRPPRGYGRVTGPRTEGHACRSTMCAQSVCVGGCRGGVCGRLGFLSSFLFLFCSCVSVSCGTRAVQLLGMLGEFGRVRAGMGRNQSRQSLAKLERHRPTNVRH